MGQYGFANDHSAGCDKRWIRMQGGKTDCRRCSSGGGVGNHHHQHPLDDNMGEEEEQAEEEEAEEEQFDVEVGEEDEHRRHVKGSQRWRNVKAVMAYYYALRKIKRNVAFVTGSNPIHF